MTWPSQPPPAPIPIVGTSISAVDPVGEHVGHALEHDGETPRLRQRHCIRQQLLGSGGLAALHLVTTHGVHRLRGEPKVTHHRDLGVEDRSHDGRDDAGPPRA